MEPRRVLRIAVIHAGRILTERLIHPDESVTIGTAADNRLVVPENPVTGARFTLFEPDRDGVRLHFTRAFGPSSKLASDGRATELLALAPEPDGVFLDPSYRGKLQLGPVVVLFQFVTPPPVVASVPLAAMDFRAPWIETDPELLGSLGSWSALGLLLSIWVWSAPAPQGVDVVGFQERLTHIQPAILVPTPDPEPIAVEEVEVAVARPEPVQAPATDATETEGGDVQPEQVATRKSPDAQRDELIQNSRLLMALIGHTGEGSDAVARAWDGGGVEDLDAALAGRSGVTADAEGWEQRPVSGGTGEAASIGQLAHHGEAGVVDGIGGGPGAWLEAGEPSGTVSEDEADRTRLKWFVNKHLGEVRYCYEHALKQNPSLGGRIELAWTIEAGTAWDIAVVADSIGDRTLAGCVKERIGAWTFPRELEGEVRWPFRFRN